VEKYLACYSWIWKRLSSPTFKDASSIIFPLILWLSSWFYLTWADVLHDIESWRTPIQKFKLPGMVHVFSVLFSTFTWPLIEPFGTPCSFSNCTGNILFACRYCCGAVFWEEARNSVYRVTASFSCHLLAIEQCQKFSLGNYFSRCKFCIKILFKMTGLLTYLYQSSLIKIDINVSLLVKRAL